MFERIAILTVLGCLGATTLPVRRLLATALLSAQWMLPEREKF